MTKPQQYTVTEPKVRFKHGTILRLSRAQADRRAQHLSCLQEPPPIEDPEQVGDARLGFDPREAWSKVFGVYEVTGPHSGEFRPGEVVTVLDGYVDKGLARMLDPPVEFPPREEVLDEAAGNSAPSSGGSTEEGAEVEGGDPSPEVTAEVEEPSHEEPVVEVGATEEGAEVEEPEDESDEVAPEDRLGLLRLAIEALEEDDFYGGRPKLDPLEAVLGWRPTRDEVSAALEHEG